VIRRALVAAGALAVAVPVAAARAVTRRGADRLLAGPRTLPDEEALRPQLDALGGEVVRFGSRDGLRLSARWLPPERSAGDGWEPSPEEAILLLHGYSGSVAPDLVEFGPFLRATAGVLGLDFRGHGGSDDGPTTFGLLEVEDVAGALAWLGEHGVRRVALFGQSMGGVTAIASVVVLGDGSLAAADAEPDAPVSPGPPPRPRIVGIVAESVPPELPSVVANRMRGGPIRGPLARGLFREASRRVGGDIRATEPGRIVGLVEPVPLLLIHGEADTTLPIRAGRRLAALAGPSAEHWVVPGAEHSRAHEADPAGYETRVTQYLRRAFGAHRDAAILPAIREPDRPDPDPVGV
jgi:pimeloyl-ACP methyl ester carboxylesterase